MSVPPCYCSYCGHYVPKLRSFSVPMLPVGRGSVSCCDDCYPDLVDGHFYLDKETSTSNFELVRVDDSTVSAICTDTNDGIYR